MLILFLNFLDLLVAIWFYICVYNLTLFTFAWILCHHEIAHSKSLYHLSTFKNNVLENIAISILLFSMAGIPPFLGFFSKLIILIFLSYTHLFILYFHFFFLLIVSLYFYLQNLRFLYTSSPTASNALFLIYEKKVVLYYYTIVLIVFFLMSGFLFLDDFFMYFMWILY